MNIAIIGTGNIGKGLLAALSRTTHTVSAYGSADDLSPVAAAEVVILATPYGVAGDLAQQVDLAGKIVVDLSNPITADFGGLQIGHDTSAAEETAAALPGATVVKAFNTVFAQHYAGDLTVNGQPIQTFVASDDAEAAAIVRDIATAIGFEAVDAGPLKNARYLEPLGYMNIQLGYMLGRGTGIAPRWQAAA